METRLAHDATGARLLRYPHFIGTIQGFVDSFLAIPYLRDVGINGKRIEDPRIDDDLFGERAWGRFKARGWSDFKQARAFLSKRYEEGQGEVAKLSYRGASLSLSSDEDLARPDSPSGKQLRALKDGLAADGLFRFEDMFAFARASLARRPFLRGAVRRRFPWVFIDEVQDTVKDQEAFLNDLFATDTIVQRLGDRNQGIFRGADDDANEFSGKDALDLPKSHRLAPRIAQFASLLTAVRPQTLTGNTTRRDRAHSVFLFGDAGVGTVLPTYGDLLFREWDAFPRGFTAKAVGFRRSPVAPPKMPGRISDYWAEYPGDLHRDAPHGSSLIESVRWARRLVESQRRFHLAHRAVMEGVAHLIEKQEGARVSRHQVLERFRDGTHDEKGVRDIVVELLRNPNLSADGWARAAKALGTLVMKGAPTEEAKAFLAWNPPEGRDYVEGSPTSVFRHASGDRSIDIVVSTIHAVKGETHDATLVLETFEYQHDLGAVIPYLCQQGAGKKPGKRLLNFMKRIFVAMTRPRELVCLALHEEHVTEEQLANLMAAGWAVQRCPPPTST